MKEVLIDNQPVEDHKTYTLVTRDYLAEGNDGMDGLIYATSVTQTDILFRDYISGYIKKRRKPEKKYRLQ